MTIYVFFFSFFFANILTRDWLHILRALIFYSITLNERVQSCRSATHTQEVHTYTRSVSSLCANIAYRWCTNAHVKDSSSFVRDFSVVNCREIYFFFFFLNDRHCARYKDAFIIPFSHLFVPRKTVALTSMLSSVCSLFFCQIVLKSIFSLAYWWHNYSGGGW